ncbi:unnamed protein product [Cuscuta campestris]|uniref:CCHC-type domain-containing protein n=1 Tax=Cuscuta campestris TaxID=132261 RepID=A0A484MS62_9ASTE|nr:unnamed protein product [Cuscuta campestris]
MMKMIFQILNLRPKKMRVKKEVLHINGKNGRAYRTYILSSFCGAEPRWLHSSCTAANACSIQTIAKACRNNSPLLASPIVVQGLEAASTSGQDIKKVENYAKAINMLYCAVNLDDYRKISYCSTAKEMWDKLEVTYEGTDQVREAKIDFLTQEYEMFKMKEHEKIDDMFDRFSKIVNDLHALKKTYTDRDLVRKILRSLTSEWRSKAHAIYESIGTSNVTIDGLRGDLKTYESTILNPSLNDQRKGITLKAVKESTMNDSSDDDEFKLIMKKFCKLLKKKENVKDGPVCYGCGEAGHIKNKCPRSGRNARHFTRQRAYIFWGGDSDDESTDQDEDETANLCLMAHEENSPTTSDNEENGTFLEKKFLSAISSGRKVDLEEIREPQEEISIAVEHERQDLVSRPAQVLPRRSDRMRNPPVRYGFLVSDEGSIYGLKQASRSWYIRFDVTITSFGFEKNSDESCVYKKVSGSVIVFLILYVDDILLMGNDVPALTSVKTWLSENFAMKDLGNASYALGIRIYRDRGDVEICKVGTDDNIADPLTKPLGKLKHQGHTRAATSGNTKSKSRAPLTNSEERLYYGDGSCLWFDSEEECTRFLTFLSKQVVAQPRIVPERFPEAKLEVPKFTGKEDPEIHVKTLHQSGRMMGLSGDEKCLLFFQSLRGQAAEWFHNLPAGEIDSFDELAEVFQEKFKENCTKRKKFTYLSTAGQREHEDLTKFLTRWKDEVDKVEEMDDKTAMSLLVSGLQSGELYKEFCRRPPQSYQEAYNTAWDYADAEARPGRAKAEVVEVKPVKSEKNPTGEKQWTEKYCSFHKTDSHNTTECNSVKGVIKQMIEAGEIDREYLAQAKQKKNQWIRPEGKPVEQNKKKKAPSKEHLQVIYGGPEGRDSASQRKKWGRELYVGTVALNPRSKQARREPTTFTDRDLPATGEDHNDPLVITMDMGGVDVSRVLVDTGNSVNVLYLDAFEKLKLCRTRLEPLKTPLSGFTRDSVEAEGSILLTCELGTADQVVQKQMRFVVVNIKCVHSAILGQPGINKVRGVISMADLCMKFYTSGGIGQVRRDQKKAWSCYLEAVKKMTKAFERVTLVSQEEERSKLEPCDETEQIVLWEAFPERMVRIGQDLPGGLREEIILVLREYAEIFA